MPENNQTQKKRTPQQKKQAQARAARRALEEKKRKRKKKIVIGGIAVAAVAAGVAVFLLTRKPKDTMTEENYKQIQEQMDEQVKEGYFETYMNTEWKFPDGESETTNAVLGNSPNNKKPIRCEVTLNDTGEKVLTTGVLPVGAEMPPFKLDVDLDPGTYDATCQVYLLNEEKDGSYTDYSNAGFRVTITVEN